MTKDAKRSAFSLQDGPDLTSQGFDPRVTQMRALLTIAREASYTRAARMLSYTESAVYLQIKALERMAGTPLVERRGNRIELTPAGEIAHRYALRVVEDVESMGRELSGVRGLSPISLGGGRSTAVYYLTPLVADFLKAHSEYQVDMNIMPAEDLVGAVSDGVLDLAASGGVSHLLASGQVPRSEIRFTRWFHGGWAIITPGTFGGLDSLKTVYLPEFAAFLKPNVIQALADCGAGSPNVVLLASGDAVKGAVLHGLGSAILPAAAVAVEASLRLVTVTALNLRDDGVTLIHRRPRLLTPGARDLLRHLIGARRSLAGWRYVPQLSLPQGPI